MEDHGCFEALMRSPYYETTLRLRMREIVQARYHCGLDDTQLAVIRTLALLSPAAASVMLLGDTELFDNLDRHSRSIGKAHVAADLLFQNLLHRALLAYSNDAIGNTLLDAVDGEPIQAQVIRLKVSAAFHDKLCFSAESVVPTARVQAAESIDKGQMVSGPPGLLIQNASAMLHLEEPAIAIQQFEQVLQIRGLPQEAQVAALNNMGLAYEALDRIGEAKAAFSKALAIDQSRKEPRKHLERLERPSS